MSFESKANGRESEALELGEFGANPVAIQIPLHMGPIGDVAVSPDGKRLLATNYGSDSVSVIDIQTCRVVDTIDGLDEPFAIAADDADRAYVSTVSPASDAIEVIDLATNTVVASHRVALSVSDLTVSADGKRVYISRNGARAADVAALDIATGRMQIVDIATTAGTTTESLRVSPDGGRLYVGVNGPSGGQLIVIDTGLNPHEPTGRARWRRKGAKNAKNTQASAKATPQLTSPSVIGTIEIGLAIRDVAVSPDGGLVYVASSGPEAAVIDVVDARTNKITGTRKIAEVTGLVTRLTLSGDGDRAYLVSNDSVTMLCTLTQDVVDTIEVAGQPSCVVESRDGEYLYIADYSGAVTVVPVAVNAETRMEQAALESKRSVDLFVPDLLQYDAALV
ncbi:YncE family protein [Mycobacterium camsae]|uniref:YncE family protein n=1 Tax=Mycobacterium gordonae TaxID=1778 RepID=UPI001F121A86|nr:YncE family protein [Mycobacterium gordonae]